MSEPTQARSLRFRRHPDDRAHASAPRFSESSWPMVMGAANAYLGLKAGMTIAATYTTAVVGMAVIKAMQGDPARGERRANGGVDRRQRRDRRDLHASRVLHRVGVEPVLFDGALRDLDDHARRRRDPRDHVRDDPPARPRRGRRASRSPSRSPRRRSTSRDRRASRTRVFSLPGWGSAPSSARSSSSSSSPAAWQQVVNVAKGTCSFAGPG